MDGVTIACRVEIWKPGQGFGNVGQAPGRGSVRRLLGQSNTRELQTNGHGDGEARRNTQFFTHV